MSKIRRVAIPVTIVNRDVIIVNKAKCLNCQDVIESVDRHDWVACSCFTNRPENTGIYIDGGREYVRRGGNMANYQSLVEYQTSEPEE